MEIFVLDLRLDTLREGGRRDYLGWSPEALQPFQVNLGQAVQSKKYQGRM